MRSLSEAGMRAYDRIVRRRSDYRTVFGTGEGKRVLRDILHLGGVNSNLNTGDAHDTAVNVGAHRLAVTIASMLNMSDREMLELAEEPTDHD